MKVKLSELVNAKEAFQKIIGLNLPVKTAYWMAKTAKKVNKEFQTYEELRLELVKKYGDSKDNGQTWSVVPEKMADFMKDYSELMQTETDVEIEPINLDVFGAAELSTADLMNLDPFLLKKEEVNENEAQR